MNFWCVIGIAVNDESFAQTKFAEGAERVIDLLAFTPLPCTPPSPCRCNITIIVFVVTIIIIVIEFLLFLIV